MKTSLRIALAQINSTVGDIHGNLAKIESEIKKAKDKGVDIIAFPELALCGYPPEDLLINKQFINANKNAVAKLASDTRGIVAIIGFPMEENEKVFNSAALIGMNDDVGLYKKMHLPNYGVFDEKRYFSPGKEPLVFSVKGFKVGVNICEDIWEESGPVIAQKHAGAELVINISASPFYAGKQNVRTRLVQSRAVSSNIPVLFVNLVGGQDELVFDGNSLAVDDSGQIITQAEAFKEDTVVLEVMRKSDGKFDISPIGREEVRTLSEVEEIIEAIELGIKDYVAKNGFSHVTLGLSGGIDSALVAALSVNALGKDAVTAIGMPSKYSSEETQSDAKILAQKLGIDFKSIPITDIFDIFLMTMEPHFEGLPSGIAEENLQARIRGNILMALSNKFGWLLLATGNKSEISVGYSTLYGDLSGGFAPIKDLPKTLVYKIANHLNSMEEVIPESIIRRAPTAELRPGQKDTDALPPYEVLDAILQAYVEEDLPAENIAEKGFDAELVAKVINMVDRSEYKRRQAPPGIKLTPRAFGRDRRFPITNKFKNI